MPNVVVCVTVTYIFLICEINPVVISSYTPKSYGIAFIKQNYKNLNRNKFKSNSSLGGDKGVKRKNNNLTKLFSNLSDELPADNAAYFQQQEEDSTELLLSDTCKAEEAAAVRSELLASLAANLSICNLADLISKVNQLIASGQKVNLTSAFSRCVISLANSRKTRELLLLIQQLVKHNKLLDLFHLSLSVRYFAQMSYCDVDTWHGLFTAFANLDLNAKYALFMDTDGLKPLSIDNCSLDKALDNIISLDKTTLVNSSLDNSINLEKTASLDNCSLDKSNCEINSLSLFGLDHSYIFARDQMPIGVIESFAMALLQIINRLDDEDLNGVVEPDNGDNCNNSGSKSKITSMINGLNKIKRSDKSLLSWTTKVILKHINRIMAIDDEDEIEDEKLYYDITTRQSDSNGNGGEEALDDSRIINTIDRIINSPLSQMAKQSIQINVPLALPRFIYPSTHEEVFKELIKATSYGRIVDIANLLFSNVNVDEVAISDVYHVSRYMLKFKRATSVIETLLRFDVLNSNKLLEHIKCSTYECEVERDPIEALKVLDLFKQMGLTHSQELIDDLAIRLNQNDKV